MKRAGGWMTVLLTGVAGLCAVTVGCQLDGDTDGIEVEQEEEVFGDYESYEQEPMIGREESGVIEAPTRPGDGSRIERGQGAFPDEEGDDPFSGRPSDPGSR